MPRSESLFDVDLLQQSHFTRLQQNGASVCKDRIVKLGTAEYSGFLQFLDEGWACLSDEDPELRNWLVEMIRLENTDIYPDLHEKIARSIRYGATMTYYPLYIQSTIDGSDIPKMNRDRKGSISVDILKMDTQPLLDFLSEFDKNLFSTITNMMENQALLGLLDIDADLFYQSAYFTYYSLAHAAEQDGLKNKFT